MNRNEKTLMRNIRIILSLFMGGLILSGLTALPIESQLQWALQWSNGFDKDHPLFKWLEFVYNGVTETNTKYPFISYGTDWLAFAHFIIALVFIGPWRDPLKNIWVIEFGILACLFIFPFALIAGDVRGIPLFWRMIDCSFGVFGGLLLCNGYYKVKKLEKIYENV